MIREHQLIEYAQYVGNYYGTPKEYVVQQLEQGKDVLIVGHGAMNCSIICQVKNIPLEKFWSAGIENCKLKRLV